MADGSKKDKKPDVDIFICFPKQGHECDSNGPIWESEDGLCRSTTCSVCGEIAMFRDMQRLP